MLVILIKSKIKIERILVRHVIFDLPSNLTTAKDFFYMGFLFLLNITVN